MNQIIQKAIEGGYLEPELNPILSNEQMVCDPSFWQALSRVCEWKEGKFHYYEFPELGKDGLWDNVEKKHPWWVIRAMTFHEINLTEGWDAAISYLESLIK